MKWSHEELLPQRKPARLGGWLHEATGHGPVVPGGVRSWVTCGATTRAYATKPRPSRRAFQARAIVQATPQPLATPARNDGAMPRRGITLRPDTRPAKEFP